MADKKGPDMKTVLKDAGKVKLNKTQVKEGGPISDHTKLMGAIKKTGAKPQLADASEALKKAEDQTNRATATAYKQAKAEKKKA
mmetsp:Transcript_2960/g.4281  ORF Transcript_2960/g.4281 Transcript_2960/m.4281 type:complete len:84 (-) Transcript_2960:108-359(-)|eukprot:CAMPEP_0184478346 /NCGR_PEP_ID=MMETSP0113_2-20130426/402_1 /TAXON_ID=91329 /ORGANISM="Norrisiella sphaerica, Strain BC52" /LENGTH=83 /DNA_ID=CAMNT_0026856105 /DNA_START=113 /DNA_END=364 /DNA_ORIENTATION=-